MTLILGHRDSSSNFDERNRIYMHNVESQSSTAQRFCTRENIGDSMHQQITPNHISREYEDYTGSQRNITKGK